MKDFSTLNSSRQIAAQAISRWLETSDFPDRLVADNAPDHPFITGLVRETVRRKGTIDYILKKYLKRKPDLNIYAFLMIGVCELLFISSSADYAAIHSAVEAVKKQDRHSAGFVNAVLRNVQREKDKLLKEIENAPLDIRYSHPASLVRRWSSVFGDTVAENICRTDNLPAETTLTVLPFTDSAKASDLVSRITAAGFSARIHPIEPGAIIVGHGAKIPDLPGFVEGEFIVQDAAPLTSLRLLDPQPGETILDACAAPGGKTMQMAALMGRSRAECAMCNVQCAMSATSPSDSAADAGMVGRALRCPPQRETGEAEDARNTSGLRSPEGNGVPSLPRTRTYSADDGRAACPHAAAELEHHEPSKLQAPSSKLLTLSPSHPLTTDNCTLHIAHCTLKENSALRLPPSALVGRIIAADLYPDRISRLLENVRRLSFGDLVEAVQCDAASPHLAEKFGGMYFDAILADVPCSNTGVLRRRADARWRFSAQRLAELHKTQLEILSNLATLNPGRIVYSTCSIEPEEDEDVVSEFLAAHPDWHLEKSEKLIPDDSPRDGAFAALLKRNR